MTKANIAAANLTRARLTGPRLTDANLTRAHLDDAHLTYADLAGAFLARAQIDQGQLDRACGSDVVLPGGAKSEAVPSAPKPLVALALIDPFERDGLQLDRHVAEPLLGLSMLFQAGKFTSDTTFGQSIFG